MNPSPEISKSVDAKLSIISVRSHDDIVPRLCRTYWRQTTTMSDSEHLFPSSLISPKVISELPEGYRIRQLARDDFKKGILDVLRVLTSVGDVTEERWLERFDYMKKYNDTYYLIAVEDGSGQIVGTGAVVVERKL